MNEIVSESPKGPAMGDEIFSKSTNCMGSRCEGAMEGRDGLILVKRAMEGNNVHSTTVETNEQHNKYKLYILFGFPRSIIGTGEGLKKISFNLSWNLLSNLK